MPGLNLTQYLPPPAKNDTLETLVRKGFDALINDPFNQAMVFWLNNVGTFLFIGTFELVLFLAAYWHSKSGIFASAVLFLVNSVMSLLPGIANVARIVAIFSLAALIYQVIRGR